MNEFATTTMELDDQTLEDIYRWVDEQQLSRPKRNIARDFSDGVLIAEIVKNCHPKLVEIHNYTPANATKPKLENWYLLNRRVFAKMNFELSDEIIRSIVQCKPFAIERVLILLRNHLDEAFQKDECSNNSLQKEKEIQGANLSDPVHQTKALPVQRLQQRQKPSPRPPPPPQQFQKEKPPQHIPLRSDRPEADQGIYDNYSNQRKDLTAASNPQDYNSQKNKKMAGIDPRESHVPRSLLEEKQQEMLAKDETIAILQSKIQRLEYLNHLKDLRIGDLQKHISNR